MFAARVGAALTSLDFAEAGIRIGATFEAIFADDASKDVTIPVDVSDTVDQLLDRLRPACLFAPFGIGGHRDHLIARQVAAREARRRKLPLFYYEDLPYLADLSTSELFKHAKSVDRKLRPVCVPIDLRAKLNNLTIYRSQLGAPELDIVAACTVRLRDGQPAERLWSSASQTEIDTILQTSGTQKTRD